MKANQVVIVMDRAEAEETVNALGFAQGNGYDSPVNGSAQMVIDAALDRDPDELEARLAKVLYVEQLTGGAYAWNDLPNKEPWRKKARAVLHALQEGTEK